VGATRQSLHGRRRAFPSVEGHDIMTNKVFLMVAVALLLRHLAFLVLDIATKGVVAAVVVGPHEGLLRGHQEW
jgi:hypothetical protein